MQVAIKLYGELKRYAPGGINEFTMEYPFGTTVNTLLASLGIGAAEPRFVLVDGMLWQDEEASLADGCTVVIFPPVSGG